jgi:broad specificity phosphatase PhoE
MLSLPSFSRVHVVPLGHTKRLHLIRHGEAFSNVYGEVDRSAYKSMQFFDSDLSPRGWAQ